MPRLHRFEDHRFLGTRSDMRVYDCDDPVQFEALALRAEEGNLVDQKGISAFAPDTLEEARNRGFRPVVMRKIDPQAS